MKGAKELVGVSSVEERGKEDIVVMVNLRKRVVHIVEEQEYVKCAEVKETRSINTKIEEKRRFINT